MVLINYLMNVMLHHLKHDLIADVAIELDKFKSIGAIVRNFIFHCIVSELV